MRTTIKTLRKLVEELNILTGNPVDIWSTVDGRNRAHVGAYVLDASYGGYRLCQIVGENGGERDLTPRLPAGQAGDCIRAYRNGLTKNA